MSDEKKVEEKFSYEVIKPILYIGSRVEKDEVIEMTKSDAKNIGSDYLKPHVEIKEEEEEDDKKDDKTGDDTGDKTGDDTEMIDHEVTQEDLDQNEDLEKEGVKVGDTIQIPKPKND